MPANLDPKTAAPTMTPEIWKAFLEAKEDAEIAIGKEVAAIAAAFERNTGTSIACVSIEMAEVTEHGDPQPKFIVAGASIDLSIP